MEALVISFFAVATAELGDKTQLIALFLASRFRRPVPIILGILAATLVSNIAAGLVGQWFGILLQGNILHWLLSASFFAAAIWAFIPDKIEDNPAGIAGHHSIFITTFISFFIAELGDKTQLATVALAAQFQSLLAIVLGTTLGMIAVNAPTVLLSHAITGRISLKVVRALSGALFAVLGVYELSRIFYS